MAFSWRVNGSQFRGATAPSRMERNLSGTIFSGSMVTRLSMPLQSEHALRRLKEKRAGVKAG